MGGVPIAKKTVARMPRDSKELSVLEGGGYAFRSPRFKNRLLGRWATELIVSILSTRSSFAVTSIYSPSGSLRVPSTPQAYSSLMSIAQPYVGYLTWS
ncbi:hypothetical protein AgCh_020936 [Apium graveolens]